MIVRKLLMLLVSIALVAAIAFTAIQLIPKFEELDFGDPSDHFTKQESVYSLTVDIEGEGKVEGTKESYTRGESVTLTAVASEGYVFVGWFFDDGTRISDRETFTFTVESAVHITAVFNPA